MFPAEAVRTPRARSLAGICAMALDAPRILNEPIGCRHSSLRKIFSGASGTPRGSSGVRMAVPAIRPRAAMISASVGSSALIARTSRLKGGSEFQPCPDPFLRGLTEQEFRRREILRPDTERLEQGDVVGGEPSGNGAAEHFAHFSANV